MDKISIDRIKLLHPLLRDEALEILTVCDKQLSGESKVRIVQGFRSIEEQNTLFAQGRTSSGNIVTNAPGGDSYHNYGLAVDFALLIDDVEISWDMQKSWDNDSIPDWTEVVHIFKNYGWVWGGDFKSIKDYPHFEKSFGLTTATLKNRYDQNDFLEENYVRI